MKSYLKLINAGLGPEDFCITQEEFDRLIEIQRNCETVEIVSLEANGPCGGYFDVRVDDKFIVPAMSGIHLSAVKSILSNGV